MAEPILLEKTERDPKAELLAKLEAAPAEHAEALLSGYAVIQELHDSGLLELVRGSLLAGDKILDSVVESVNKPEAIRAVRNLLILVQTLKSIDPDVLERVAGAVPGVIKAINDAHAAKPPTLLQSAGLALSGNTRRGLAAINGAFQAVRQSVSR